MKNLGFLLAVVGFAITLSLSFAYADDGTVKDTPACRGLYDALKLQLGTVRDGPASGKERNPIMQVDPGADPHQVIVHGVTHRYMQVIGVNLVDPDENAFSTRLDQATVTIGKKEFIIPNFSGDRTILAGYLLREAERTRKSAVSARQTVAFDEKQTPAFYMTPFKIGSKPGRFYVQKHPYYADPYETTLSIGQCGSVGCIHVVDTSLGYARRQDIYVKNSSLWVDNGKPDYSATLRWTLQDLRQRIKDAKNERAALEITPADFGDGDALSTSGVSLSEYRRAHAVEKARSKAAELAALNSELKAQNCLAFPQATQRSTAGVADTKHGTGAEANVGSSLQSGGSSSSGIPQ